jgi:hypothetical protein
MNSRYYGGIHWRYDNEDGLTGGTAVGHFVSATQLLPIPEPFSWHLLAAGIISSALWRRRSQQQKLFSTEPTRLLGSTCPPDQRT